ncbi:MAG: aldo/keto reductase [Sphingomonadales bacterium]
MTVETFSIRPDFEVSRLAKGNWQLAKDHSDKAFDQDRVNRDMEAHVDAGITTFVCGDIYAGVEEKIGNFRDYYRKRRGAAAADKIKVLTTYVPFFLEDEKLRNHSKADCVKIIDRSLKRLQQDRLDLVQMHWWNYDIPGFLDMALALQELQKEGKIHHLGATNFDTPHMKAMFDEGIEIVAHTIQYSLLDRRPENGMVDLCRANDCQLVCYGVLGGGLISEKWLGIADPGSPNLENVSLDKYYRIICDFGGWDLFQELMKTVKAIADKHSVSMANVATRYVLDRDQAAIAIIGTRNASYVDTNVRAFEFRLDEHDYAQINAVLASSTGPAGDCYEIDRAENRDALEEVKTDYFDVENGELVKKSRPPVILEGDEAYGHHVVSHKD